MHAYMTLNAPSTFVSSYEEGIRRAKEENYAFIMESASTEYITERDCDLQRVGHVIDYQLLGVMFPKGNGKSTENTYLGYELQFQAL